MHFLPFLRRHARAWLALGAAVLAVPAAHAVPSYARQTGMDCAGCHVGAYGPQLTPAGIRFKLGGYTDTDGKDGKVPLSGMLLADFSHTSKAQDPPPDHLKGNDNTTLDEASLFIAGRAGDHVGAFVQLTYDGVERNACPSVGACGSGGGTRPSPRPAGRPRPRPRLGLGCARARRRASRPARRRRPGSPRARAPRRPG